MRQRLAGLVGLVLPRQAYSIIGIALAFCLAACPAVFAQAENDVAEFEIAPGGEVPVVLVTTMGQQLRFVLESTARG